jgi:flagellar biosynthesis/type III secretory pathway M-ring protein FliF/YscJ
MLRAGPRAWTVGIAAVLVMLSTAGFYAILNSQIAAQCGQIPPPASCAAVWPGNIAQSALFISLGGLLAAVVLAVTAGVTWRRMDHPNVALARQIEAEDNAFKESQERRIQLEALRELALAHLRTQTAKDAAANAEAGEAAAAKAAVAEAEAALATWKLEEETAHVETIDERRRRVLADRLVNLAKTKPEAVADVIKLWINQRR